MGIIKMDVQEIGRGERGQDCSGSGWRQVAGYCECDNEISVSEKKNAGNFD